MAPRQASNSAERAGHRRSEQAFGLSIGFMKPNQMTRWKREPVDKTKIRLLEAELFINRQDNSRTICGS